MPLQKAITGTLALLLMAAAPLNAGAADFTKSQKSYVPPSFIDRRVDFTSVREHQALEEANPKSAPAIKTAAPKHNSSSSAHPSSTAHHTATPHGQHPYANPPAPPVVSSATGKGEAPALPPYADIDLPKASKALRQRLHSISTSPATAAEVASLKRQADELVRSGRLDEAKQTLSRIAQLTPQDKQLLKGLSNISVERAKQFASSAQFDQATKYARQALSIDGSSVEAKTVLDGLISRTGANPHDVDTRIKSAETLASQGRMSEAGVEYAQALKVKPNAGAHIGLAKLALQANQRDKAKAELLQALEVDSNSASAHQQLGMLKYHSGDVVGANSELSRALILNHQDKDASGSLIELWQRQVARSNTANSHLGLARAYQLSGDLASAQTEYRTVVQLDPQNPHIPAARQAFKLAMARSEANKASLAAHSLENQGSLMDAYQKVIEAQRLSPGDPELRVHQGQILEKMQNGVAARRAYMDALQLNPNHVEAANKLKSLPSEAMMAPTGDPAAFGMGAAPAMVGAMASQAGMMAAPMVNHDPVAQLSNFAVQLRNHAVVQKAQLQKAEDFAHSVISKIGQPEPSTVPGLDGLLGGVGGDAAAAAPTAATAAADIGGNSLASTLASAASAIAAAKGIAPPAANTAQSLVTAMPSGTALPVDMATPIQSSAAASAPASGDAYKKVAALQKQNQSLQDQLNKMKQAMGQAKSKTAKAAPVTKSSAAANQNSYAAPLTQNSAPIGGPGGYPAVAYGAETMPQLAPPMSMPAGGNSLGFAAPSTNASFLPEQGAMPVYQPQSMPQAAMQGMQAYQSVPQAAMQGMQTYQSMPQAAMQGVQTYQQQSLPQAGMQGMSTFQTQNAPTDNRPMLRDAVPMPSETIKLALEAANVKMTGVELSVVLRNDGETSLSIPAKLNAIIKYSNRKDAEVKTSFANSSVPAHGQVRGLIKVPFDKVDPNADLILQGLMPAGSASRDVHLTTSMAAKP